MDVSQHISALLFRFDCVTVPGFGSFLGQRISAVIDEEKSVVYPPFKAISFNSQLQFNDGLLANEIARFSGIRYEEAVLDIQRQVAIWNRRLQAGNIQINRLGTLELNEEGNVVFTPFSQYNHLAETYGLSECSIQPINRTVYADQTYELEKKIPIYFTPRKRNLSKIVRYVAAAALVFAVANVGYNSVQENQFISQKQALFEQAQREVQQAVFDMGKLSSLDIAVQTSTVKKYHIIGGAFRIEENAGRLVKKLKRKGYFNAARLAPNANGLHPVSFGSYASKNEALVVLRQVQKEEIRDAWLLKQ